ncbi:hypothetical protein [Streptomyces rubiginosohelvolus]|uniref:hypothetical protein n=1 Tax=Streptomyces rubiginosohelvolus TaxID=67362 RepID=UPI0035D9EB90
MSIDYEAALPHLRVKFAEMGLSFADGTLTQAAAMGITQLVWRNGPIENAHAGERGRRNGLHDGVMFARNTWVFHQALEAVRSTDQYALLSFEDRILDRSLVWPGTNDTLSRFGYGALGDIRKHAKGRVNYLLQLEDVYGQGSEEFLLLAGTGALFQQDRFGMPGWEPVVERMARRLRGEDKEFVSYLAARGGLGFEAWLATAPSLVHDDLPRVVESLRLAPYRLDAQVLQWFTWNPVLTHRAP